MDDVNNILKEFGFGLFHVQMLCTSFVGYFAGVLATNITPYILPNAECDLDMNLYRKGILAAIPFIGMIFSSVFAGFLTDTFGRKIFLVGGYGMMAVCNITSGFSQTYGVLLTSKFFEGLVFAVAFNPTIAYTSEFCHSGIRQRVMLIQAAFLPASLTCLAGITWIILINDWKYTLFDGAIVLNTWNIYILILTTLPVFACTFYFFLPESPKYLVLQQRYAEAKQSLIYVYRKNYRKPADTFPYTDLWKDQIAHAFDKRQEQGKTPFFKQVSDGMTNVKPLFKRPHGPILLLFCTMNFLSMNLYNVIRMWFPQLSTIVEHYSKVHSELCDMLNAYTHDLKIMMSNATVKEECVPKKSGSETYTNSIIMGCACIPPYIIMSLIVNRVGMKSFMVIASLLTVVCCLYLRWANDKTVIVALFAIDLCLAMALFSLMQAVVVIFFPTSIRTLALALTITIGRIGSLLGNIMFPFLLDKGCAYPLFSLATIMTIYSVLAILSPSKKKRITK